jgi:hypothetical protein
VLCNGDFSTNVPGGSSATGLPNTALRSSGPSWESPHCEKGQALSFPVQRKWLAVAALEWARSFRVVDRAKSSATAGQRGWPRVGRAQAARRIVNCVAKLESKRVCALFLCNMQAAPPKRHPSHLRLGRCWSAGDRPFPEPELGTVRPSNRAGSSDGEAKGRISPSYGLLAAPGCRTKGWGITPQLVCQAADERQQHSTPVR